MAIVCDTLSVCDECCSPRNRRPAVLHIDDCAVCAVTKDKDGVYSAKCGECGRRFPVEVVF